MKRNDVLKKHIKDKYGSAPNFIKKEKFPPKHLEIMFGKKDVFQEIEIGLKICAFLNIGAAGLFCRNEISDASAASNNLDNLIKEEYAKLSADKRKKVLEYADDIFKNGTK
jgi:hypothetical protein